MEDSIEIAYEVNGHGGHTHTVNKSDVFKYTSPEQWRWYKTLDSQHENSCNFWRAALREFGEVISSYYEWAYHPWGTAIKIERESMHKLLAFIEAVLDEHEAAQEAK